MSLQQVLLSSFEKKNLYVDKLSSSHFWLVSYNKKKIVWKTSQELDDEMSLILKCTE